MGQLMELQQWWRVRLARLSKDPAGSRHSGTVLWYNYACLIVAVRISSHDGLATFRPVSSPPTDTPVIRFFRRCRILYSSSCPSLFAIVQRLPPLPLYVILHAFLIIVSLYSVQEATACLFFQSRVFSLHSLLPAWNNTIIKCSRRFLIHSSIQLSKHLVDSLKPTLPLFHGYSLDECVVMSDL